jgi:hypothetical protein
MLGMKNKRYFVINSVEGYFTKYNSRDCYPKKPNDVYALHFIQALRRIPSAPKQEMHFFEVRSQY